VKTSLTVGELTPQEKSDLFTKIMSDESTQGLSAAQKKEGEIFLAKLPPFPLDVSVAAYYLKTTQISYDEYLNNLIKSDTKFINTQEDLLKEASDYTKTRFQIIASSVRHLIDSNKDFQDLLLFISLIDSQDIPRDLLNSLKDKLVIDSLMYNLKKYSLITSENSHPTLGSAFSIHRNTQEIILTYLTKIQEPERNAETMNHFIEGFENHFEDVINNEKYTKMKQLINHLNMFLSHDTLLPPSVKGSLESELGCIHYFMDRHENALQYLNNSLIHLEKVPDANEIRKARVLSHIAKVYREQGDYKKAENIFRKSIVIYQGSLKTNSLELARTLAYLGSTCSELGNFEEAKYFLNKSLNINQTNAGSSLWKAWILIHLAFIDRQLGNYNDAQKKYEESLTIYRLAGNDKRTYRVMGSLSRVYYKLGDYQKAMTLLEECLDNYTKLLSDKDANAATLMNHLGNVYAKQGKYDKAKLFLENSLEIHENLFGKENVRTLGVLGHLGNVLAELGNAKKATELIEKTLISYEEHYGADHLETAEVLLNLGRTYLKENNFEKAETLFIRSLKIYTDKNHPEAYIAFENLSDLYKARADKAAYDGNELQSLAYNKRSRKSLNNSLDLLLANFPKSSPHILRIQSKMEKLKKE
jgi:tetratricopeptide (TPR) repeat protein